MSNSRRLILAHFWFAFVGFGFALMLGEWQMFMRSPLHAPPVDRIIFFARAMKLCVVMEKQFKKRCTTFNRARLLQ